jgi:hypothetical protein
MSGVVNHNWLATILFSLDFHQFYVTLGLGADYMEASYPAKRVENCI